MACSTGGPAALHRILSDLPGDLAVPILIVQHITQGFAAGLADWLNKESDLRIKLAEEGESPAVRTVYLAARRPPSGRVAARHHRARVGPRPLAAFGPRELFSSSRSHGPTEIPPSVLS